MNAVETVARGGVSIDKDVAGHLLELVQKKSKPIESSIALSPREHEILVLLGKGLAKKEIGEQTQPLLRHHCNLRSPSLRKTRRSKRRCSGRCGLSLWDI